MYGNQSNIFSTIEAMPINVTKEMQQKIINGEMEIIQIKINKFFINSIMVVLL
jgi:hypothetical protein